MGGNGVIEDIAAEIGFTAASKLIVWFGGRTMLIPSSPTPDNAILKVIGDSPMRRLCEVWGGSHLYVPLPTRFDAQERDQIIAKLIISGVSVKVIAEAFAISESLVNRKRRQFEREGLLPLILAGEAGRIGAVAQSSGLGNR